MYILPYLAIYWRDFTFDAVIPSNTFGTVEAEVVAIYVRKATARPNMPIAYLKVVTRYIASPDPSTGQESTQIPVWGQ